jgi:hypothetical protein
MTTGMDDRRDTFEKKFVHDADLRFKAEARRNKLLGLWAAERLGKKNGEAEAYARDVVAADFLEVGRRCVSQNPYRFRRCRSPRQ